MSLQDDIEYLKARLFALEDRVKTSPHFRWGTVVTSVPLTIILDGAAEALPGTPANAGPKVLMAGERVRVELQGNRAVVHAVGGRVNDLRGTTAQRINLAYSDVAAEGVRFYDTDENIEYVWLGGLWVQTSGTHAYPATSGGGDSGWVWSTSQSVTFPTPFPSVPQLFLQTQAPGDFLIFASITAITASGFTYRVVRIGASVGAGVVAWRVEV